MRLFHDGDLALVEPSAREAVDARAVDRADVIAARPAVARWISENFEAVVVAFIMALIIRCFCIEVFKIPTASMEPTLLGDAAERDRSGDRIMVNKFAYEFGPVERFDVVVFKYPLDLTRNFIKRVVGLPDEDFWLRGGDAYVRRRGDPDFTLARKPVKTQENIWIPVYADGLKEPEFHARWRQSAASNNWQVRDGALRTFAGPGRDAEARFEFSPEQFTIQDWDPRRQGTDRNRHAMSDLRLGARVEFLAGAGEFELVERIRAPEGEQVFRVILVPGRKLIVDHPDPEANFRPREWLIDAVVQPEKVHEIALLVYDGSVAVILDGKIVHDVVYRSALPAKDETYPTTLGFAVRRGEATVRDVTVGRDLYHFVVNPPDGRFPDASADRLPQDRPSHIPPESFLLLGDNVRNSSDGRVWQRVEVVFRDGSRTWWDNTMFHETDDRVVFLKKVDGNPRETEVAWEVPRGQVAEILRPRLDVVRADGKVETFDERDVEDRGPDGLMVLKRGGPGDPPEPIRLIKPDEYVGSRSLPGPTWVERRHIVGKAFWIWWPTNRWFRVIR